MYTKLLIERPEFWFIWGFCLAIPLTAFATYVFIDSRYKLKRRGEKEIVVQSIPDYLEAQSMIMAMLLSKSFARWSDIFCSHRIPFGVPEVEHTANLIVWQLAECNKLHAELGIIKTDSFKKIDSTIQEGIVEVLK